MFGPPPADYVPTAAERDMAARCVPSPEQLAQARKLLRDKRGSQHAYVPLAFPGKRYGFWSDGQPVEYPEGIWVGADADRKGCTKARDTAVLAACAHLGERDGTPAYAVIYSNGAAAVFEDFRIDRPRELAAG